MLRPAGSAIRTARERAAPRTRLAAVQGAWTEAVGTALASCAEPCSERTGEVTIECADAVWAQELELMQPQLLDRLRERLGTEAPERLRFHVNGERFQSS